MATYLWVNIGSGNGWLVARWHQAITWTNVGLFIIIKGVLWHSPGSNFTGNAQDINSWNKFEITILKSFLLFPGRKWVNCATKWCNWVEINITYFQSVILNTAFAKYYRFCLNMLKSCIVNYYGLFRFVNELNSYTLIFSNETHAYICIWKLNICVHAKYTYDNSYELWYQALIFLWICAPSSCYFR